MMKNITGDTLWTKINEIPKKYPYLSNNISCDVVIIGGGITGAICSYFFTKAGVNTVLIDKNIIGYGSTRGSTSLLQYEIDYDLTGLKGLIGLENAVKAFKYTQQSIYKIKEVIENELNDDCDFSMKDCFYYSNKTNDVKFLENEYNLRKNNGFNVQFLNEKEARSKYSFNVKAGIYTNGSGGQIDPYRFTHALLSKSVEKGLSIFENTEMIDFKPKKNEVELITLNNFKINAKKAVFATGFETRNLFDKKSAIMTRTFTIVTKPVQNFDGWFNQSLIRDTEDPYTYLRTTGDNRILIGGLDENLGGVRSKMSNLKDDDPLCFKKYETLRKKLITMFPNIKDIEIEYGFSGFFGESKDGLPYAGEYYKYPNCYFCLGYGSNGILSSMFSAEMLKDLYLGNKDDFMDLLKIDR